MLKYKKLALHLRTILESGTQIKSIVYSKDFSLNIPSSHSLLSTCSNNLLLLEDLKNTLQYNQNTTIGDKYLFYVMVGEYVNTGRIVGGGQLKRMILRNQHLLKIPMKSKIVKDNVQIRVRDGERVEGLEKYGVRDRMIEGVYDLTYPQYSELCRSEEGRRIFESKVVIQSRSSCLPAWLLFRNLKVESRMDVIDCCAAPGNKTIQLSEQIGLRGTVLAFEKSEQRYNTLERRVKKYGISNIKASNEDFLATKPGDKKFRKVRMILADPSCSGSGMLVNFPLSDTPNTPATSFQLFCHQKFQTLPQTQKERIMNLQQFQLSILNHCASFNPVRLSYSTCSIYEEENEEVVRLFLQANEGYRVKRRPKEVGELLRGFGEVGRECMRMDPRGRKTDGFFVCIFKKKESNSG